MSLSYFLPNTAATHTLGFTWGQTLTAGTVLLLEGELGSGKTTLVQSIGQGLGINEPIVSPTFTLINEYDAGRLPLYHIDLYRLQPGETGPLYLDLYWQGIEVPLGIVAIEWPERLTKWPQDHLHIQITYEADGRRIQLSPSGQFDLQQVTGWQGFFPLD